MLKKQEKTVFPPNNIGPLRKAAGLTMDELGEALGTDASTINKLEKSRMRLTDRWLEPLARALGCTIDDLFRDGSAEPKRGEIRRAPVQLPPAYAMPNDVPVRGTAAGSHLGGAFQFEGGVVDYVRRPPALAGATNAYALYVEGTSMVPEHNPGDLRFVHPDRPPRVGDSVVVEIQVGPAASPESIIGRLLRRTEKAVYIGKLNPEATVELKRETVKSIHKVLTINDLFGV